MASTVRVQPQFSIVAHEDDKEERGENKKEIEDTMVANLKMAISEGVLDLLQSKKKTYLKELEHYQLEIKTVSVH